MRLPTSAHTSRPWRVHELTRDFWLEDVWALPTPGAADDFPKLAALMREVDPGRDSRAARTLFTVRLKLGELFGWDSAGSGLGTRVPTLRDRLPDDLRAASLARDTGESRFSLVYEIDDESAAEIANETVHAVLHLGWVPDGVGGYSGQMAVLVKPNGRLGNAYMAAITPFRRRVVYPQLLRAIGAAWHQSESKHDAKDSVRQKERR